MNDEIAPRVKKGSPAWMATFSDLMSLLMCFFILLLSFSEMDVLKFKQLAGSMKFAFGVQNQVDVKDIPKGTSVIAQEFSPGRPEPTPINVIMQHTTDFTKQTLDFADGKEARAGGTKKNAGNKTGGESNEVGTKIQSDTDSVQSLAQQQLKQALEKTMQREIEEDSVEIESLGQQITIRIKEKGAFPANSAFLQPKFIPLIHQIAELVKDIPGQIDISGHTDNTPLESELYRSNWDISAQRAVSVAQEMEKVAGFDHTRMRVEGFADTKPLVPNRSPTNRAINRRVDITITQGQAKQADEISIYAKETRDEQK